MLYGIAINTKTVRSHQKLVDADVKTNGIISSGLRSLNEDGEVNVEVFFLWEGLASPRIFEEFSLVVSNGKFWFNLCYGLCSWISFLCL